ncbi:MAG: type II toxin-antitoxin system VapB family antitoxin, partial [Deltaproteobacteria bacterium]|nr:type II toxin-antitoxin system VapB family antitoxin [Deltaproteobacteria bacterium]
KKATVSQALLEYIQRRRQLDVLELFGTVEYDSDYDYKQQRKRE